MLGLGFGIFGQLGVLGGGGGPIVAAPTISGSLADVNTTQLGGGTVTVNAAGVFVGSGITYTLTTAPAGVTINASTGVVTIARDNVLATSSVVVRGTNAGGFASAGFSVTITAGAATRPNETVTGGALTLSGAGRRKPRDSAGVEYNISAATLQSGSLGGRTIAIVDNGLAFTGAAGWPAGAVIRCTHSTGTMDMTIGTAAADTYDVASVAEMEAVNALGVATLSGKRMRLRRGEYFCAGTNWLLNKAMTSEFVICGDDVDAYVKATDASHERVKIIGQVGTTLCSVGGLRNVTFEGVCVEGRFNRRTSGNLAYVFDYGASPVEALTYRRSWIKGDNDMIGAGTSFRGLIGSGSPQFNGAGLFVTDCLISDGGRLMNLAGNGNKSIVGNTFRRFTLDVAVVSGNEPLIFTDNIEYWPEVDPTNILFKDGTGTNAGLTSIRSEITGNADGKTGLFYIRYKPRVSTGTRRVFGIGTAGGATSVYLNQVADKLSFVAQDTAGATAVTLTSVTSLALNVYHNVLISINTDGTSVMHIWQEGGAQGVSPTSETVTASAAGQVINWTGGGFAIGGYDQNTATAGSPCEMVMSRLAYWPGIAPNITLQGVRDTFYEPTLLGAHRIAESNAAYGVPLVDAYGTKAEWIAGAGLNVGSAPERFVRRSSSTSLDIGHIDFHQGVVNTGVNTLAGYINPTGWVIERNVAFAGRFDGITVFGGGQFTLLEDIFAFGSYNNISLRNNLSISATNIGIAVANPKNIRVLHNTMASLPEMFDPGNAFELNLPKISGSMHDPENNGWRLVVDGKTGTFTRGQVVTSAGGNSGYIFDIIAQDATTATVYLQGITATTNYAITAAHFVDNEAITAPGVTATVNLPGSVMLQERSGLTNTSYFAHANIARDIVSPTGGDLPITTLRKSNNPLLEGSNNATLIASYAPLFVGSGVVGEEFVLSRLTSIDAIKAIFATNPALRNAYEVKIGWDAYWNQPSPYNGVANAFTVAATTGALFSTATSSAIIAPTGLTATGVAAWAEDAVTQAAVNCRLLDAADTVLRDWTTNHLLVLPGQKVQVQRTTGVNPLITQNTTVVIGDKTANWALTTKDIVVIHSDTFASDTKATWTWLSANPVWSAPEQALNIINDIGSFPVAEYSASGIVIGRSYRIRIGHRKLTGPSSKAMRYSVGDATTVTKYLTQQDIIMTATQGVFDFTVPAITDTAALRVRAQSRAGTTDGLLHALIEFIEITEL